MVYISVPANDEPDEDADVHSKTPKPLFEPVSSSVATISVPCVGTVLKFEVIRYDAHKLHERTIACSSGFK